MTVNTSELVLLLAATRFCHQTDRLRDASAYDLTVTDNALVVRLRRLVVLEGEQDEVSAEADEVDVLDMIDAWRRGERW